jgi:hypothetical protein
MSEIFVVGNATAGKAALHMLPTKVVFRMTFVLQCMKHVASKCSKAVNLHRKIMKDLFKIT